jgi:signal transduction histidine kinase
VTVLQRETERRRLQLESARQEIELLLESQRAAKSEADLALARAAAAARARDESVSTLAHDLKAPLANVSWYMELLGDKLTSGELQPSLVSKEIDVIRASAAELMTAADELRDLARLADVIPVFVKRERVDLVQLVVSILTSRRDSEEGAVRLANSVENLYVLSMLVVCRAPFEICWITQSSTAHRRLPGFGIA